MDCGGGLHDDGRARQNAFPPEVTDELTRDLSKSKNEAQ